jgi:hypothetical protein
MNGFYKITQSMKEVLTEKGFNVVTIGDNFKVDIARQTIFPYVHIVPDGSVKQGSVTAWNFVIIGMDIVDINKEALRDQEEPFYTTDNMQDVLNDIYNRLAQFCEFYERGDGWTDLKQMTDDVTFTAFMERYENVLAGWEIGITITTPTEIPIC